MTWWQGIKTAIKLLAHALSSLISFLCLLMKSIMRKAGRTYLILALKWPLSVLVQNDILLVEDDHRSEGGKTRTMDKQ
jgi:hypothetical protein